jgi:hypothetical protein
LCCSVAHDPVISITTIYYLNFIHRPYVLQPQCFKRWYFPRHQVKTIEASSIDRTQQRRFHLMTREEPSLETLWLQNIRALDEVQKIDRSNTEPSSETFRYELLLPLFQVPRIAIFNIHVPCECLLDNLKMIFV